MLFFYRLNALIAVCLIQAWMMWNFIHFHLRKLRERQAEALALQVKASEKKSKTKNRKDDCKFKSTRVFSSSLSFLRCSSNTVYDFVLIKVHGLTVLFHQPIILLILILWRGLDIDLNVKFNLSIENIAG